MTKQEIDFVDVIADDDFSVPGGMVRKDEPFRCTRKKAKELVAIKKAHYPTAEERQALSEKPADADAEGDQAQLEAKRSDTQAADADADPDGDQEKLETQVTEEGGTETATEEAPAKAEAPKPTGRKASK